MYGQSDWKITLNKEKNMLKEREVVLKLTVNAFYDGEFDQEELKQKLLETLKEDHWDCTLEVEDVKPEQAYKR